MPEALATTKRKFYKALDSLQNPPAARPTEPASKRVRRSISTTSTVSRHNAATPSAKEGDGVPKAPPNFSPWSHETFLARLKTFSSVSLWHPKPEAISEVEWAKRGWKCVDVNTVACRGGCEKRVVVRLDTSKRPSTETREDEDRGQDDVDENEDDEDADDGMEDALVRRYKSLIVDGHAETCMWHRAGCKDDIYRLQVVRPTVWQPELRKRYQSLQPMCDAVRYIKLKALPHDTSSLLSTERLLAELPADVLGPPGEEQPAPEDSLKTLEVALHGWRGSEDSGNELLHCDTCFQRIGLWMYQPDYRTTSRASSDDESDGPVTIDLVEMHRDHCPWRNPDTQKSAGSLRGLNACQILQRVVSTCAREQRRRSEEQQRASEQPEGNEQDDDDNVPLSPAPSRDEVERQDKERDTRLKRLKSLFTVKRKANLPSVPVAKTAK